MKHTIISWDSSFRNFFHLIDGLLQQNYNREEFEVIYVEQRSKELANKFNHNLNLKSLWDRYEEVKNQINIKVLYLNDDFTVPYHLGTCNNAALKIAKGDIISIMDGDMLLPSDFLSQLEEAHSKGDYVYNLYRFMCPFPVNVDKQNWWKASFLLDDCLAICPDKGTKMPDTIDNKGPMISAKKEYWQRINGYDPNLIWSTSVSRSGQDVCARLEIATGSKSLCLKTSYAVHPWHPIGISVLGRGRRNELVMGLLSTQQEIIDFSRKANIFSWNERQNYTDGLLEKNRGIVNKIIKLEVLHDKITHKNSLNFIDKLKHYYINNFILR